MTKFLLTLALTLAPSLALADVRIYVLPRIDIVGRGGELRRVPKYVSSLPGIQTTVIEYVDGQLLIAADLTNDQHTAIIANSDVVNLTPLDAVVGARLAGSRTALAALRIPSSWVQADTTWRQIASRIGRTATLMSASKRLSGRDILAVGVALTDQLTAQQVSDLQAAGAERGLNSSRISTSVTVENGLLDLADQMPNFSMLGELFQ